MIVDLNIYAILHPHPTRPKIRRLREHGNNNERSKHEHNACAFQKQTSIVQKNFAVAAKCVCEWQSGKDENNHDDDEKAHAKINSEH